MSEPKDVERCDYMHVHEDIVALVNHNMPDEEVLYDLAELFKILRRLHSHQDPVRPV